MEREITQSTFIRKILEIYEVDPNSTSMEKYGFLKKIYDSKMDENQIFDFMKKNSLLKGKLTEIMKRKEMLDNICDKSWSS